MSLLKKVQRNALWKDVNEKDWTNWKWQQRNTIRKPEQLLHFGYTKKNIKDIQEVTQIFRMRVTPYFASLVQDKKGPIGLQTFPQKEELIRTPDQYADPLSEDFFRPYKVRNKFVRPGTEEERLELELDKAMFPEEVKRVDTIIHKYDNRVLFYTTANCAMTCRHCTRKRLVNDTSTQPNIKEDNKGVALGMEYIASNPEIIDVILSGGDVLSYSNQNIDYLLGKLDEINHVQIKRLGTRNLVTLPYRVDDGLAEVISNYVGLTPEGKPKSVRINTHFNHPEEITYEAAEAVMKLKATGASIGNQAVLLKGVNDIPETMKNLYSILASLGIDPYYLYQCDKNFGNEHFRTPLEVGLNIMDALTTHTSGVATPHFIKDLEGGHGKVHLPGAIKGIRDGGDGTKIYDIQTTGAAYTLQPQIIEYKDIQ